MVVVFIDHHCLADMVEVMNGMISPIRVISSNDRRLSSEHGLSRLWNSLLESNSFCQLEQKFISEPQEAENSSQSNAFVVSEHFL